MNVADVQLARQYADLYKLRGFQPLPSRTDAKRPLVRFADWWEAQAPADLWDKHKTTNIQVMTGRHWRLLVIDLDGIEAQERWAVQARKRGVPRTWVSHSGANGRHLWFRLPEGLSHMHKAFLWRGQDQHSAIERLCDRSLITAPPSIHVKTGKRYQFASRSQSPLGLPMPAMCPAWILKARPITTAAPLPQLVPIRPRPRPRITNGGTYQRDDVLASISVRAVAASWGVRFVGRTSPTGWISCHAIGREDKVPSAAIHQQTGQYVDQGTGIKMSLFDLGAALGVYEDWRHTLQDLGARYARVSA
jgi:Bifunctional DNA primase/polymerase, N-terminal